MVTTTYKPLRIGTSTFNVSAQEELVTAESVGEVCSSSTKSYTVKNTVDASEVYENVSSEEIDHVMKKIYERSIAKVH